MRSEKLPVVKIGKYESDKYYCDEFPDGISPKEYNKLMGGDGYKQKHYNFARSRTINGCIAQMFINQVSNSKYRNHTPPQYTKLKMFDWIMTQPNVTDLFLNWIESKFKKDDVPSCDRVDNTQGYSLENLSLMIWAENNAKGEADQHTPVLMLTSEGKPEREFVSLSQAAEYLRAIGFPKANQSAICSCCRGKRKTAYGFKWKYK